MSVIDILKLLERDYGFGEETTFGEQYRKSFNVLHFSK